MFDLEFTKTAQKQLYKLDREVQIRIISNLERIRIRPYSHVKKLVGNPYFRLRVGDFRIIMDIKKGQLIILLLEVGHRKNIYK